MIEAETNPEIEPSPDAPQGDITAAPQVHYAPLCAASGSKLKGLWGRCPQPPSPCGFAHMGDRCPVLGHLPHAPMPMRLQASGACCSKLHLDRILFHAPGCCFAGAPERSTEDR